MSPTATATARPHRLRAAIEPAQSIARARQMSLDCCLWGSQSLLVLDLISVIVELGIPVGRKLTQRARRFDEVVGAREQQRVNQCVLSLLVIVVQPLVVEGVALLAANPSARGAEVLHLQDQTLEPAARSLLLLGEPPLCSLPSALPDL